MNIELTSPTHLKITWSAYTPDIERQIIERLRTVPGIEGRGRRWLAPIIQFQRLVELFPKASLSYEAMTVADDLVKVCYQQLVRSGIELRLNDAGDVEVAGDTSAEISQYVADRSHALRPFVKEQMEQGVLVRLPEPVAMDVQYPRRKSGTRKRRSKA